jgi:hypothetical protein
LPTISGTIKLQSNARSSCEIPSIKAHYILVVFGDEKKFYQDKEFFPILSRQVYNQMLKK